MTHWHVSVKLKRLLDLICRQSFKFFRLLKHRRYWYVSAKERWMTFPLTTDWESFGSLGILLYVEMELLTSLQGRVLITSLLDRSQFWGSQGRMLGLGSRVGSLISTGLCVEVLTSTQQAREPIPAFSLAAESGLLSCNSTCQWPFDWT